MRKSIDPAERDFIRLRLSQGHSISEVAKFTNRASSTISRYARTMPGHKKKHPALDVIPTAWMFIQELRDGHDEPNAAERVAAKIGCNSRTIDKLRHWVRTGEKPGGNSSSAYDKPPPQDLVDAYFEAIAPSQSGFFLPPQPTNVEPPAERAGEFMTRLLYIERLTVEMRDLLVRLCVELGLDAERVSK